VTEHEDAFETIAVHDGAELMLEFPRGVASFHYHRAAAAACHDSFK